MTALPPPPPSPQWQQYGAIGPQPFTQPPLPGLRHDGSTKGPSIWVGVCILAMATVIVVAAIFGISKRIEDFTDTTVFSAPDSTTVELDEGDWRLMSLDDGPAVDVSSIDVDGPGPIEFRIVDSTDQFVESRNVGRDRYSEIAAFEVTEGGRYTFDSTASTSGDTDLLVARSTRSLIDSVVAIGGWAMLGLFGGFLFLVGLIPLIMSLVNRSRANRSREYLVAIGQLPSRVID